MNSKVYKWCAVPQCKNTSIRKPNKVFVHVPNKKIIRDKWLKLARRNPNDVVTNSPLYFCEDHFDLPNDMENYMQYHVMGSVSQVRMKPGCMPHKFICQLDRKTRTSHTTERPYIAKKRRKMIFEDCKKEFEKKCIATERSSFEETASGSSDCRSTIDTNKFGVGQVSGKIDCTDFNEPFQRDAVKNEPNKIDIFAKPNTSSRNETDLEDHKHFTGSHQEQNKEKRDAENLDPKNLGHSIFLENLSTSTCNAVEIKNEDIDIFYEDIKRESDEDIFHEDIKRETGVEKSIRFCEWCYQSFGDETDMFKSTSYRSECSCQKQNELLTYNKHSEDMTLDVKPSLLDPTTDIGLEPLEVQDDIFEEEVTKEGDACAVPRRLLVIPMENDNKMKRKSSPEPLENNQSVAEKKFQCKVCSKSFYRIGHLKAHLKVHTGDKPFHCKICSKSFSQKGNLTVHMRIHTGEKPFCCKICSKAFAASSDLKVHGKAHRGEKPFCCEICSMAFSTSRYLINHERIHTDEKFHCRICSKAFTTSRYLRIHGRIHKGENLFRCKICSKSFIRKELLQNHERIHTGEKPFHCKVCSKSFSQKVSLNIHMRLHTREKPFRCKICAKAFTTSGDLKVHGKVHT